MSEIYYIEAKTVEEAIAIANRKYSDDKHEVTTEIIALPKRGFLGIGAKDAKIKVTVTESQSSELSSLVSDMKKMKSLTNRGNEDRREDANRTADRKQPSVKTRAETQKPQPKKTDAAEAKKTQPKGDKPAGAKPSQPKQTQKPTQTQPKPEKTAQPQPKPEKPAQSSQPKAERPAPQPKQDKPERQPKPQTQPTQPKPQSQPKPTQTSTQAAQPTQPAQPTQTQAQPQPQQERRSSGSLNNQVKSKSRRMSMNRTTPAKEIDPSGVTVSAPIGVENFTSTTAPAPAPSGFGSFGTGSSGRMSNDIKKKSRQPVFNQTAVTDPGKANLDALKALTNQTAALQKAEKAEKAEQKPAQPTQPAPAKPEPKPEQTEKREPREPREDKRKPSRNQKRQRNNRPQTQTASPAESAPVTPTPAPPPVPAETTAPAEEKLRECVTQEEMDFALEFANTLLTNMKLDARAAQALPTEEELAEVKAEGEANVYPKINIVGGDTGILIGHHGETLDSIQYLINLSAIRRSKQKDGDYVKIVVDIEGYREKREETLRSLARRMASRAVKYRRNIYLEPMNAYERRIIHSELQSFENVSTHSVGSDRDRKIVITYEGPDKRPYQKRERKPAPAPTEQTETEITEEKTDNPEDSRPSKPKKLPIEELDTLLESREDPIETEAEESEEAEEAEEAAEQAEIDSVEAAFESAESALETLIESAETVAQEPTEITEESTDSPEESDEITE